jgi:hypothetical protein
MARPSKKATQTKQTVIRLQLDGAAKEKLDEVCDLRGMTQIAVLSRLVKWFANQDEVVQASVLNLMSEERLGDLSRMMVQSMYGGAGRAAGAASA